MLASSTGIALSISCIVDCTEVTASISRVGAGERGDGEVEARVGLPVHGRSAGPGDRLVGGLEACPLLLAELHAGGQPGHSGLDDPAELEGVGPLGPP